MAISRSISELPKIRTVCDIYQACFDAVASGNVQNLGYGHFPTPDQVDLVAQCQKVVIQSARQGRR